MCKEEPLYQGGPTGECRSFRDRRVWTLIIPTCFWIFCRHIWSHSPAPTGKSVFWVWAGVGHAKHFWDTECQSVTCISVSFVCLSCLNLAAVMQAQQQSTAPRPFSQPRIFEGTGQRLGQWERSKPYLTLRHTLAALGRWSLLQCLTFPHLQCEMGLHATWCDLMSLPK